MGNPYSSSSADRLAGAGSVDGVVDRNGVTEGEGALKGVLETLGVAAGDTGVGSVSGVGDAKATWLLSAWIK